MFPIHGLMLAALNWIHQGALFNSSMNIKTSVIGLRARGLYLSPG